MTGMTWRTVGASALALLFASSMAAAQAPLRVRGTIESVDGPNLSVKDQHWTVTIAHTAAARHQSVVLLNVGIGVE